MTNEIDKFSFGKKLKILREKTRYPSLSKSRNYLTQMDFGRELGKFFHGAGYSENVVQNWENGLTPIDPRERDLLCGIICVLKKYGAIKTPRQANSFLALGTHNPLSPIEKEKIDPSWVKKVAPKTPKSTTPMDAPNKSTKKPESSSSVNNVSSILNIQNNKTTNIDLSSNTIQAALIEYRPGSAPPPPSLIVGREKDMLNLKSRLGETQKDGSSLQVLTAVHGWPGVGKTTIASALAHDEDLKAQFTDAILWTSLGQEPNVLSELSFWGRILGNHDILRAKTVDEARTQLAALLRNKRVLLIIDDVWKVEDAYPFMVGGVNCATLITTRLDGIANTLSPTPANQYRLKVLEDKDALELLEKLAPSVVKTHPKECLALVKDLEGLPLAIQVAGRLLHSEARSGFSVLELIEDLKADSKLLESIAPADRMDYVTETTPTIGALLQKSLDRLDQITLDCYAYLGVIAPKPATFDFNAMKFIWGIEDPKSVIRTLVDRGLLEYIPEMDRFQMHAVLVMLAKSLLTDDETEPAPTDG